MSLDILAPLPPNQRNADDMGVPSELAPSKSAGPAKVVAAVSTGSLPVSSAEVLSCANYLDVKADAIGNRDRPNMRDVAMARYCAEVLRRHAALMTERQPEGNDGTQRPGSPDVSLATETRKPGSLK